MKTPRILFVIAMFVAFIGIACKKQLIDKYNQNPSDVKSTSQIKAAASFNWATFKTVAVSFVAKPEDVRTGTFKVIAPDGTNLFQKFQKANEGLNFNLEIPNQYDSVLITYNTYSKYFSTKSGFAELRLN